MKNVQLRSVNGELGYNLSPALPKKYAIRHDA